jgi:hypothetical protein
MPQKIAKYRFKKVDYDTGGLMQTVIKIEIMNLHLLPSGQPLSEKN